MNVRCEDLTPGLDILTPKGIKEKVRITKNFIKRKMAEYEGLLEKWYRLLSLQIKHCLFCKLTEQTYKDIFLRRNGNSDR